jgi:hypothetical protein
VEELGRLSRSWREVRGKSLFSAALVAHACNPSYSEGRDQEDRGLKPDWANS